MRHRFITGDSLSAMRKIPDRSVDLVLGSPPYADARTYGIGFRLKGEPYVEWCIERYLECDRICRGMVVWVIDARVQKFQWGAEPVLLAADLHRRGIKLRRLNFYYRFGVSGSGGPDDLRNDCELILRSSHGRLPWSDNTACGEPPKFPPGGAFSNRSKDGTRQAKRDYKPPEIANPGNVIRCTGGQLEDICSTVVHYAYATQARPDQVLRVLQIAHESKDLSGWFTRVDSAIYGAEVLHGGMYGSGLPRTQAGRLPHMPYSLSTDGTTSQVLQARMRNEGEDSTPRPRTGSRQKSKRGEAQDTPQRVQGVSAGLSSTGSPHRRKPTQQQSRQSDGSVLLVPPEGASETGRYLPDMWSSRKAVQGLWDFVRHALPSLQAAWRSAFEGDGISSISKAGPCSGVIRCTVGGGHMGHPLAKSGEAPFPLKLAEFYVRSFCPPGGTVLDPFAGTGTVMHAAEIHGRNSINIDIRRSQIDIMKERLNDITSNPDKWYPATPK